jgi:hypothetical protein
LKTGVRAVFESVHSPPIKLGQGSKGLLIKIFNVSPAAQHSVALGQCISKVDE